MPNPETVKRPVGSVKVEDVIPAVNPGLYLARFDSIESQNNETGNFWLWTFTLDVPGASIFDKAQYGNEDALIPLTSTSSPRITPRTKAAKWLEGLGQKIEVGAEVDFDKLIGSVCQVLVITSDGGYSRIDSVLPAPPKGK